MSVWLNDETNWANTPYDLSDVTKFRTGCAAFEAVLKNLGLEVLAGPDFSTVAKVTTQATAVRKIYGFKGDGARVVFLELAFYGGAYGNYMAVDIRAARAADLVAGTLTNPVMPFTQFFKTGTYAPKLRICVDATRHTLSWFNMAYSSDYAASGVIEETNTNGAKDGRGVMWAYCGSNSKNGSGLDVPGYAKDVTGTWAFYGVPGGSTADGANNLYLFPVRPWSLRGEESPFLSVRVGMSVDFSQDQVFQVADYTGLHTFRGTTDANTGPTGATVAAFLWE